MRAVFLALLLASTPVMAQEPPAWFSESLLELREDVAEAAKHGKRVMLYFGQDGCPYCKRLMEVNFRQAAIAAKAQKNLVALALNIWGDREVTWVDGAATTREAARRAAQGAVHADAALPRRARRRRAAHERLLPARTSSRPPWTTLRRKLEKQGDVRRLPQDPTAQPAARDTLNPQPFFLPAPHDLRRGRERQAAGGAVRDTHCAQCDELHAVAFKRQRRAGAARQSSTSSGFPSRKRAGGHSGREAPAGCDLGEARCGIGYVPAMVLFDARGRRSFPHRGLPAAVPPRRRARIRVERRLRCASRRSSASCRTRPSACDTRGERVDLWN